MGQSGVKWSEAGKMGQSEVKWDRSGRSETTQGEVRRSAVKWSWAKRGEAGRRRARRGAGIKCQVAAAVRTDPPRAHVNGKSSYMSPWALVRPAVLQDTRPVRPPCFSAKDVFGALSSLNFKAASFITCVLPFKPSGAKKRIIQSKSPSLHEEGIRLGEWIRREVRKNLTKPKLTQLSRSRASSQLNLNY